MSVQVVGVPAEMAERAVTAVNGVLNRRSDGQRLHVIASRERGSWHVFVVDTNNDEMHDVTLSDHLLCVLKEL
jgi:hypothetical protein